MGDMADDFLGDVLDHDDYADDRDYWDEYWDRVDREYQYWKEGDWHDNQGDRNCS